MYIWPNWLKLYQIFKIYDMKIFTKLLLPVFLIVSYFTGYGASVAFGVNGEGIYVPKSPLASQTESGNYLISSNFKPAFDLSVLNKDLFKSLSVPKRIAYNFTANSSGSSMLGLQMINTNQGWDDGQIKPTLSAFPNPTKGMIVIKLEQTGNDFYKINVSNTIGQVLKTIKVPDAARESRIKVDLSDYPAGVYFYSLLVNDKMVETKRLILQQ